jgi:hypothetical protein
MAESASDGPVPDWYETRASPRVQVPVRERVSLPVYPQCVESTEPCWVARCRHSLLTDVGADGRVREVFEKYRIDEIQTCSLRVGRDGEHSIEQVAAALGRSEESVRMELQSAIAKMATVVAEKND